VIRGCYARKEGAEREQEDIVKQKMRALRKTRRKKADDVEEESSQAISELSLVSPTKRIRSTAKTRREAEASDQE
jgi:hypothetical protein